MQGGFFVSNVQRIKRKNPGACLAWLNKEEGQQSFSEESKDEDAKRKQLIDERVERIYSCLHLPETCMETEKKQLKETEQEKRRLEVDGAAQNQKVQKYGVKAFLRSVSERFKELF